MSDAHVVGIPVPCGCHVLVEQQRADDEVEEVGEAAEGREELEKGVREEGELRVLGGDDDVHRPLCRLRFEDRDRNRH